MESIVVWTASNDGVEVELRSIGSGRWILEMTEGPFSGYPVIALDRKHLKDLYQAAENELERDHDESIYRT